MFLDDRCVAKFPTIDDYIQSVLREASQYE